MSDERRTITQCAASELDGNSSRQLEDAHVAANTDFEVPNSTWDSPDDPNNPYNWPTSRKVSIGILYSTSQLVTTMSASMVVPALDSILKDVHMGQSGGQIAFSVFFLGLGFAPFVVGPLSELYGRRPVWLAGNATYILWNALCPVGRSPALLILGRLSSACGASVGITLTGPALADMYGAKDRGTALAIGSLLPYVGIAVGPLIGGVATEHLSWPWLFWILSITDTFCTIIGFLLIPETYGPVLQRKKTKPTLPRSANDSWTLIITALRVPLRLLLFRPIIQLISFALALEFGVYTLVLGSYADLWRDQYHQSATIASLHYIAFAIGALLCAQIGSRTMNLIWLRMKAARPDQEPVPEYRLPYMAIGLVPCAAGLFWFGWAAQASMPWIVIDIGIVIFTLGGFMYAQALIAYLLDEFPQKHSASASAASRLGTYVLGFVFPIFGPRLHKDLGYGWGYSLLGFLFISFSTGITLLLYARGAEIRSKARLVEEQEKMRL